MIRKSIEEIKKGTAVKYGIFHNITFEGTDDEHVILKDKNGNVKKVYKSLFMKYGRIVD